MPEQKPRYVSEPIRTGNASRDPPPEALPLDAGRRRVLFRATHRGTHENDLLIGGFVAARIGRFSAAELDTLETILDMPDPELADYLTGRRPIPPEADSPLLRAMRDAAQR